MFKFIFIFTIFLTILTEATISIPDLCKEATAKAATLVPIPMIQGDRIYGQLQSSENCSWKASISDSYSALFSPASSWFWIDFSRGNRNVINAEVHVVGKCDGKKAAGHFFKSYKGRFGVISEKGIRVTLEGLVKIGDDISHNGVIVIESSDNPFQDKRMDIKYRMNAVSFPPLDKSLNMDYGVSEAYIATSEN